MVNFPGEVGGWSVGTWNDRALEVGDDQIHTLTRIYATIRYIYAPSGKPNMEMETSPWLKMCFLMWTFLP